MNRVRPIKKKDIRILLKYCIKNKYITCWTDNFSQCLYITNRINTSMITFNQIRPKIDTSNGSLHVNLFLIFTNFFRLLFSLQSFHFHIFTKKQFVILSSLQCVCYSLARDKLHTIRWHTKTRISVCSIQCNNVRLLSSWFCAKTRTMIYSFVKLIGILIVIFNKDIWTHLSLIHIWRCRRYAVCRSRWSPYH